jgi:sRNA-binding protein
VLAVYQARRRPLKVGIHEDIVAALGDAIEPRELKAALAYYTRNVAYLRHMLHGAWRIDLAGNPAGEVSRRNWGEPNFRLKTIRSAAWGCARRAAHAPARALLLHYSVIHHTSNFAKVIPTRGADVA